MEIIELHKQRLKRFTELGAPEDILENERNLITKYESAWERCKEIGRKLLDKFKEFEKFEEGFKGEFGEKYKFKYKIISAINKTEAQSKRMEDAGFIIFGNLHNVEYGRNIIVAFTLYHQSKYIEIGSDSLPPFSKHRTREMQYGLVNRWNQENPLIKVYHMSFSNRGDSTRVITHIDKKDVTDTDILMERMFLLVDFIEEKTRELDISDAFIKTVAKQFDN